MRQVVRLPVLGLLAFAAIVSPGCPHRSPLWSPDGKHILLLAGPRGEEVDKAASELWLVDAGAGAARKLEPPATGARYAGAAWIDDARFVVLTGDWREGGLREGSGKVWIGKTAGGWAEVAAPEPNPERSTLHLPVVCRARGDDVLVYAAGAEDIVVASLTTGKEALRVKTAEPVGRGPRGGFLASHADETSGGNELLAFSASLEPLWKVKFSTLRREIAARVGKDPLDIVFNDTSTSHLPLGGEEMGWTGVVLTHPDPNWRDGVSGYYVRLKDDDGSLLGAAHGICLPGAPASTGGRAFAVTAPDRKGAAPAALRAFDATNGKELGAPRVLLASVEKAHVHGYAIEPRGKRLALVLNAPFPRLVVYEIEKLGLEREIPLR